MRTAKETAERQTVVTMNQAVQAFKQEFGFLPPLALHEEDASGNNTLPPVATWNSSVTPNRYVVAGPQCFVNAYGSDLSWNYADPTSPYWAANKLNSQGYMAGATYRPGYLEGFSGTFSGPNLSADFRSGDSMNTQPDRRFSDYSLAYYLVGALPAAADGVEGPGMWEPRENGSFDSSVQKTRTGARQLSQQGKVYPPLIDTSKGSPKLQADNNISVTTSTGTVRTGFRLVSPGGKPYRYYRWKAQDSRDPHGLGTVSAYQTRDANGALKDEDDIDRLRIPALVGNPRLQPELRGTEYAIVSCGPDGVFGDMPLEANTDADFSAMAGRVNAKVSPGGAAASKVLRDAARKDNIVEVGR